MEVTASDTNLSEQAKTIAKIKDFDELFSLLEKVVLTQEEQDKILVGLQEINSTFEYIINFPSVSNDFIVRTLPIILEYLSNGPKNFINEHSEHLIRRHLLEILSRFPYAEIRKRGPSIYSILFNLIEEDNEEIALLALRLVNDLDRKFPFQQKSIDDIKQVFAHLKKNVVNIIENLPRALEKLQPIEAKNLSEMDIDSILPNIFYPVPIEGANYQLMPKGINSLKILADVTQFYIFAQSFYKNEIESEMHELTKHALSIIQFPVDKTNPNLNHDAFIEFFKAQSKFFSIVSLMTKNYDEKKLSYIQPETMPQIVLNLFKNCPNETPYIRRDLISSTRVFLVPSYRMYFAKYVESFFDVSLIIGANQMYNDQVKSSAYGIIYDILHHTRDQLSVRQIEMALTIFSKNLNDNSLYSMVQIMTCRLILNLVDSYGKAAEKEGRGAEGNELFMKAFNLFTAKIASIVKHTIPSIRRDIQKNSKIFEEEIKGLLKFEDSLAQEFIESLTSDLLDPIAEKKNILTKDSTMKLKFDFPETATLYTSSDCRMMLRTIINSLKVIATKMREHTDRAETMVCSQICVQISQMQHQNILFPIKYGYVQAKNLDVFIQLFTKGLKVFDIFTIAKADFNRQENGGKLDKPLHQLIKEEADLMESFTMIFMLMSPHTYRTMLRLTIDYFVQCVYQNNSLTHVVNSFLSKRQTAFIFSTILMDYLIDRMEVLGQKSEMSNLQLRLFKDVFKSVSHFSNDMQHMLKPHLHKIVNNSMKMALKAPEPYNFFLLLRALFRSIGGGVHDALYTEFLPMLRSLLQGLNALQSGVHRQNLKDLFVELCLTIPVRLSSLLPYLPWLMDPLVAALNANQIQVISQGLRTLELCVDNLQPDFLYEHILPIRTELMQALWKTLRNPQDQIANVSFRILGKLGGSNHKLMMEPQKLEYIDWRDPAIFSSFFENDVQAQHLLEQVSPSNLPQGTYSHITINFPETAINTSHANQHTAHHSTSVHLPVDRIIEATLQALKHPAIDNNYKKQCWEIIKSFFAAHLQQYHKEDDKKMFHKEFSKLFSGASSDFLNSQTCEIFSQNKFANYIKFPDERIRKIHELAFTAMLIASVNSELSESVNEFMVPMVRHYVLVAIFHQVKLSREKLPSNFSEIPKTNGMDPFVLVDATLAIISEENKDVSNLSVKILHLIFDTAFSILGSRERVGKLVLFQYILERVCALCYERAWFCKQGGCIAMKFLFQNMSLKWNFTHQYTMLKAMIFVMIDLSHDLSSGVISVAKDNVEQLIRVCCKPLDIVSNTSELIEAQRKAIYELTQELVRNFTNSDTFVRSEAMRFLQVVADVIGQNLTDVVAPHKDILSDMIPPRRHKLIQHPCNVQIGLLDANIFCVSLKPALFVIDPNVDEHMTFVNDVLHIASNTDEALNKFACYKNLESLVPLRKSCLKYLAACYQIGAVREKVFTALMNALDSDDPELQECAYECFEKYPILKEVDAELIRNRAKNLIIQLSSTPQLHAPQLQRFQRLAKLFDQLFLDKFCEQLNVQLNRQMDTCLSVLRKFREKDFRSKTTIINQIKQLKEQNGDLKVFAKAQESYENTTKIIHLDVGLFLNVCKEIINTFTTIRSASDVYVEHIFKFLIRTEYTLDTFVSRYFHECVKMFFLRYPASAINMVERHSFSTSDPTTVFNFLRYLLEAEDGGPFRAALEQNFGRMLAILKSGITKPEEPPTPETPGGASPAHSVSSVGSASGIGTPLNRYKIVRVISILVKFNPDFLNDQPEVLATLKNLWLSDLLYHDMETKSLQMDPIQWREPRLVAKCLLAYFKKNPNEIEVLFMILRAFCRNFFCNFNFLVRFLDEEVRQKYSIEWKRAAFLKFVEIYHYRDQPSSAGIVYSQVLLSRILQYICIPIFAHAFNNNLCDEFIGPMNDSDKNLIHAMLPLILPEQVRQVSDTIKIYFSQICCLIVEHASHYIKPGGAQSNNNRSELRHLMAFAWLCLESKNLDPSYKYYGHLLFAHLITKFQVKYQIVQRVFSSLMQASVPEARPIVREALSVMMPTLVGRQDGTQLLSKITKNVIVQDGNQVFVIFFSMQFIMKNYEHFYPTRHLFLSHITQFIFKVGLALNATVDNRKLVLDLIEVIIRWEHRRITEQKNKPVGDGDQQPIGTDDEIQIEYQENILLTLSRFICLVHEFNYPTSSLHFNNNSTSGCPNLPLDAEYFSKRSLNLLKMFFKLNIWPKVEFKHNMIERALSLNKLSPDNQNHYNSVCIGLEILILFLENVRKEQILPLFKELQKPIAVCCTYNNSRVLQTVCTLLSKLMAIFPPNCSSTNVPPKTAVPGKELELEPLEQLYTEIHTFILNGFQHYEKNNTVMQAAGILMNSSLNPNGAISPQILNEIFGAFTSLNVNLSVLKAACDNQPSYIDRLFTPLTGMLNKLTKEHVVFTKLQNFSEVHQMFAYCVETIILGMELIRPRLPCVSQELRRQFIQNVYFPLIEKSTDVKLMKACLKLLDGWIRLPPSPNQKTSVIAPQIREKVQLLYRISHNIEKRMNDDIELNRNYLELIHFIYSDDSLRICDVGTKLEVSFMAGLRCALPNIREKYFTIIDSHLKKRLYDRVIYMLCEQNWDSMGGHFWIKQCIELILALANGQAPATTPDTFSMLPLPTSFLYKPEEKLMGTYIGAPSEPMQIGYSNFFCTPFEELDKKESIDMASGSSNRENLLDSLNNFYKRLDTVSSASFLNGVSQLCHLDSQIAHHIWVHLFPRIYAILGERQQILISLSIAPFLISGSHLAQKDAQISSIGTFFEAMTYCRPKIVLRPSIMKYIGKNHNQWHRVILMIEDAVERTDQTVPSIGVGGTLVNGLDNPNLINQATNETTKRGEKPPPAKSSQDSGLCVEMFPHELAMPCITYHQECSQILAQIYEELREEDYWCGIWQRRARYDETLIGIAYESQGYFEQAKGAYELAMNKARNEFDGINQAAPHVLNSEYCLWEQHWIRCSKELNQWDFLLEYASHPDAKNPWLIMESAWRIPNWEKMHEGILFVESNLPKESIWKCAMYKGYNIICNPATRNIDNVQKMVDLATTILINEWRRLPFIVSSIHMDFLHAAHQIVELQEAGCLHQTLYSSQPQPSNLAPSGQERTTPVDMKSVIKTWKNRLPVMTDDLSHWSDIFSWRQHHYEAIVHRYETVGGMKVDNHTPHQSALLGAHASAQSLIHYAKIARKHNLVSVSLDSLNRIHTIPKVPIVDCFQKIKQQLKCYLSLHYSQGSVDELQEGLSVIESTHLKYFGREMISEFYALKGHFLRKLGQYDEAEKSFSVAVQMHDVLVKSWALWGDFSDELFMKDAAENKDIKRAVSAIIAYLHACRIQNEAKARKLLSKVLFLQSFDDKDCSIAQATEKYNTGVPPQNWVPWIPQLFQCLSRPEGQYLINILIHVSKCYPQAVYFPARTLYSTLRLEHKEFRNKLNIYFNSIANHLGHQGIPNDQIQVSTALARCTKVMAAQRDTHPTLLSTLEGIIDQLSCLNHETWHDPIMKMLRQALAKFYTSSFEHRMNVENTPLTNHSASYLRKLVMTFSNGVDTYVKQCQEETISNKIRSSSDSQKRVQTTMNIQECQKLKNQFVQDFDMTADNAKKLHVIIGKLKKWIKILENYSKTVPKSWYLEEKCRFLSNFSKQTFDSIALPGEFISKLTNGGNVYIAKFMPRVEVVFKENTIARRIFIRGHNGRIYPYLVFNDVSTIEARLEERFLQFQRLTNVYFCKNKETARRLLNFTIPKVVAYGPANRLVEDNVSSLSLLDIHKQYLAHKNQTPDVALTRYYERLAAIQQKGNQPTQQTLRDIVGEIQETLAPKTLIREWAFQTYNNATEFWHFRKLFTQQLSVSNLCEYAFFLNRLNPEMLYLHRDSGLVSISYYRFDLNDESGEFNTHQPSVPFRLTHSIQNFITPCGLQGPFTATMIATANCFSNPNYKVKSFLLAILRDEIISWHKRMRQNEKIQLISQLASKAAAIRDGTSNSDPLLHSLISAISSELREISSAELTTLTIKAANSIFSRLKSIATFEGFDSKVSELINRATDNDSLSKMDPAWHPWL